MAMQTQQEDILKFRRTTRLAIVGIGCAMALAFGPTAQAATYPYTATVTVGTPTPPVNGSLSVGFALTLGGDFPANYGTSTEYEIVLCPDPATATFVDGFTCYAVSDAVQRNGLLDSVPTTCPDLLAVPENVATGGRRLATSGGACRFALSDFPVSVQIPSNANLPLSIRGNGGKARISVQSVKRYGDDGNVCLAGVNTGIGLQPEQQTGDCATDPAASENAVCQPFCYIYNGTPRLVGEKAITITGTSLI